MKTSRQLKKQKTSKLSLILILLLGGLIFLACQSLPPKEEKVSWRGQMNLLYAHFSQLVPYIYSPRQFSDLDQRDTIKGHLSGLLATVKHFEPEDISQKSQELDPLFPELIGELEESIRVAKIQFDRGYVEQSRFGLKQVTQYCFRCHTTSPNQLEFGKKRLEISQMTLSTIEKAELYTAAQRFAEAQVLLENLLNNAKIGTPLPLDVIEALEKYKKLVVRVENKPQLLLKQVQNLLKHEKDLPLYFVEDLQSWNKALTSWIREKPKKVSVLAQAQSLLNTGLQRKTSFADRSGDVELLRSTSLLHQWIQDSKNPSDHELSQVYYLLGRAYEELHVNNYPPMDLIYYRKCIRKKPHSKQSRLCLKHYEQNLYVRQVLQRKTALPEAEIERLRGLRNLAL